MGGGELALYFEFLLPQECTLLGHALTQVQGAPNARRSMQVMEWYGLLTTGKTPRPVIEKLNTEVAKILNKPDVQAQLIELGAQPVGGSVRDFATQIESDIQMWSKVVKKSAVRAD